MPPQGHPATTPMELNDEQLRGSLHGKFQDWEQVPHPDAFLRLQQDLKGRQPWRAWYYVLPAALLLTVGLFWYHAQPVGMTAEQPLAQGEVAAAPQATQPATTQATTKAPVATNDLLPAANTDAAVSGIIYKNEPLIPAEKAQQIAEQVAKDVANNTAQQPTSTPAPSNATTSHLALASPPKSATEKPVILTPAPTPGPRNTEPSTSARKLERELPRSSATVLATAKPTHTEKPSTSASLIAARSNGRAAGKQVTHSGKSGKRTVSAGFLASNKARTPIAKKLRYQKVSGTVLKQVHFVPPSDRELESLLEDDSILAAEYQTAQGNKSVGNKPAVLDSTMPEPVKAKAMAKTDSTDVIKEFPDLTRKQPSKWSIAAAVYHTRYNLTVSPSATQEFISAQAGSSNVLQRLGSELAVQWRQPLTPLVALRLSAGGMLLQQSQQVTHTDGPTLGYTSFVVNGLQNFSPVQQQHQLQVQQQQIYGSLGAQLQLKPGRNSGFYIHGGGSLLWRVASLQQVHRNGQLLTSSESEAFYGANSNDRLLNGTLQMGVGYNLPLGKTQLTMEPEYRVVLGANGFGNGFMQTQSQMMGLRMVLGF